jgi:hypothetical protein
MTEHDVKDIAETLCMIAVMRALAIISPTSESKDRVSTVDTVGFILAAHLLKARRDGRNVDAAVSEACHIARDDFATVYQKEVTAVLDEWGFKQ